MEIVVKGRNVEVPDHYRVHVAQKLSRLERYDRKGIRIEVELYHEPNRRQAKKCQHVEITAIGRGPVIRAEAGAADFYAALDAGVAKLEARLRKSADRRRVHHGRHTPISVAEATAPNGLADHGRFGRRRGRPKPVHPAALPSSGDLLTAESTLTDVRTETDVDVPEQRWIAEVEALGSPGRVGQEKEHSAEPMTIDEALSEMERVGDDFYLFADADSGRASVVYRRKGFDYGLVRLSHG
jgi:ribosomal subunit interface protein